MGNMLKDLGSWLLLLGIIVAVLVGLLFGYNATWGTDLATPVGAILAILGFVIGLLSFFAISNITHDKVPMFLIGALILVILAYTTSSTTNIWTKGWGTVLTPYFTNVIQYLAVFAAPAAVIIGIKAVWDAGKTKDILPKMK